MLLAEWRLPTRPTNAIPAARARRGRMIAPIPITPLRPVCHMRWCCGRQHDPVGVELQCATSLAVKEAIVEFECAFRNAERERGGGEAFHIAGEKTMSGKINDAVLGERSTLERRFVSVGTEMKIGSGHAQIFGNRLEFIGSIRQLMRDRRRRLARNPYRRSPSSA